LVLRGPVFFNFFSFGKRGGFAAKMGWGFFFPPREDLQKVKGGFFFAGPKPEKKIFLKTPPPPQGWLLGKKPFLFLSLGFKKIFFFFFFPGIWGGLFGGFFFSPKGPPRFLYFYCGKCFFPPSERVFEGFLKGGKVFLLWGRFSFKTFWAGKFNLFFSQKGQGLFFFLNF